MSHETHEETQGPETSQGVGQPPRTSLLRLLPTMKIRAKIVLLLLVFGLVPTSLVFANLLMQEQKFRDAMSTRVAVTAEQTNEVIDRNLYQRYGDVQAFGLNAAATDPANWQNPGPSNPLIRAMNGYMTGYGIYKLMMLVSPEGELLAVNTVDAKGRPLDTVGLYGQTYADASWLRTALTGAFLTGANGFTGTAVEQPAVSPLVANLYGEDGYVIPFSAPVRNAAGEVVGAWVNFADFGLVEDIVAAFYEQLAADGMAASELTVLDPEGRVIVDYDPVGQGWTEYRRNFDVIGKLNLAAKGVESAVAAVKRGERGAMVSMHARKKIDQASGYARSTGAYDYPGLGWSALVRIPVEEAFAAWDNMIFFMLLTVAGAAAAIVAVGYAIGLFAARPIRALTDAMHKLADGDKTVDIPAATRADEIGDMARTVQVFKENAIKMDQMVAEQKEHEHRAEEEKRQAMMKMADDLETSVKGVVESVSSTSTEVQNSAESMATTAEETSRQSAAVAAASEQASANVQTAATAAEELSTSIEEIGRQVAASAKTAEKAVAEAESADGSVQGLAEAAQRIGEVVELINDIASQTNLLALNATIEAARAGDAGKGFAVVASEVKSLANQTAKATDDIASQVSAIQGATEEAVKAIQGIGGTIGEINEIATTIASAVEEQSAATGEIARNVQQAAKGTQDVSSNITGVNDAAKETGAAATQILGASGELAKQAEGLREKVDTFLAQIRAA
ncbi:MAG: methyl-accepting chemotaxis protein [Alphaproteobacteria bacterium]